MDIVQPQNVSFHRLIRVNYKDSVTGVVSPFPRSGYTPKSELYQNGVLAAAFTLAWVEDGLIDWSMSTTTLATLNAGGVYDFDIILISATETYQIEPPGKFRVKKGDTTPTP